MGQQLLKLLQPFKTATARACQDNEGLACVVPTYNIIYMDLKSKLMDPDWTTFHDPITKCLAVLDQYIAYTSHASTAPTVLDPRLNFYFFDRFGGYYGLEDTNKAMEFVLHEVRPNLDTVPAPAISTEAALGEDPFAYLSESEPSPRGWMSSAGTRCCPV